MAGYKERDFSIRIQDNLHRETSAAVYAGRLCLILSIIFGPIFGIGAITCGILAIFNEERKDGTLILILTPVAAIIGAIIFFFVWMAIFSALFGALMQSLPMPRI